MLYSFFQPLHTLTNSSHEGPPSGFSTTEQRLCQPPLSLKSVLPQLEARFLQRQQEQAVGEQRSFHQAKLARGTSVPQSHFAGLGHEEQASLMATGCSGGAATPPCRRGESCVVMTGDKCGFLWADRRKSATLSTSSGPPRP